VQVLCDAHNRILAAENPAAAIASVLRLASFGRTASSKAETIAKALSSALQGTASRTPEDIRRETLQSLMLDAARIWRNAQRVPSLEHTQPLSCGTTGPLEPDAVTGALRGPRSTFTCAKAERCAAALYMFDRKLDLGVLVDALHPDKLPEKLAQKQETKSRRKALKELQQHGPRAFKKTYCRALGDAYFAVMCPPGHSVATTNVDDFGPLCGALKKPLICP
jgi:hypothetical protein